MKLSQNELQALRVFPTSVHGMIATMFERVRSNPEDAPVYGTDGLPIDPDYEVSVCTAPSGGGAVNLTLPDGSNGAMVLLICADATDGVTVTPDNALGFTAITFNREGDGVVLAFDGMYWYLVAKSGETSITGGKSEVNTQDDNGAISLVTETTFLDANAGALAMTLADGYAGQRKKVVLVDDAHTATITPDSLSAFTQIVLTQEGDSADFLFDGTNWALMSLKAYTSTAEITTAGATAIPASVGTVVLTSGGNHELSLADGDYIGQKINIICIDILAGDLTLPVTNFSSPSYITASLVWDTAMDSCILMWDGTYWQLIANNGVVDDK